MIQLLKQLIKYIPLLIELRLNELLYNLLMFNAFNNINQLIKVRQRIEEIRTKIKEL